MNALVVDDSTAMRRIVQKALESAGWRVRTGANGQEALLALESGAACDLVLTDWHMPLMDGLQLVKAIRGSGRFQAVRIFMVTSEAQLPMIDAALAAGANDFLMKPFSTDALCERVAEVMGG
jgi:two-component system chemotaxis response regulator CheY